MFLIKFLYYFNDMFYYLTFEISNLIIYEIYVSYNQMLRPIETGGEIDKPDITSANL